MFKNRTCVNRYSQILYTVFQIDVSVWLCFFMIPLGGGGARRVVEIVCCVFQFLGCLGLGLLVFPVGGGGGGEGGWHLDLPMSICTHRHFG